MNFKTVFYSEKSTKLSGYEGIRIAFISDLHSCKYGEGQIMLIDEINRNSPDIILFGGDIFDDTMPDDNTKDLIKALSKNYPVYYVTGNHEYRSEINNIFSFLESCGVIILHGECKTVNINGNNINICGIDDPEAKNHPDLGYDTDKQLDTLKSAINNESYTILITHRPENIAKYLNRGFDLVLAGHAHGGQWRIPYILNGLFAPNQGLFPKYAGGKYTFENTTMIVGRGLAKESTIIPRIFNPRELVMIDVTSLKI